MTGSHWDDLVGLGWTWLQGSYPVLNKNSRTF